MMHRYHKTLILLFPITVIMVILGLFMCVFGYASKGLEKIIDKMISFARKMSKIFFKEA